MSSNALYQEGFNVDAILSRVSRNTVALHDYEMVTDTIARVVVAYTGDDKGDVFLANLTKLMNGLAQPVRNSFRRLTPNSVVGFVAANRETRVYDQDQDLNKYRAVTANILMDRDDSSMWEMKEGAAGTYLCRQGVEDLSELTASLVSRRTGVPRLSAVAMATVAPKELVAYVDPQSHEIDYGLVVSSADGKVTLVSAATQEPVEANAKLVVHAAYLDDAEQKCLGIETADAGDKSKMVEYYRKAYPYAPEYVSALIEMINKHAFA